MAVTKTTIVSVLVVLAITCNQGAARPSDITNNELSSSEEVETRIYKMPTAIKDNLVITLTGCIDTNDTTFVVELPSLSGKESCKVSFNYMESNMIFITPSFGGYESGEHNLKITPGAKEGPLFSLLMSARMGKNGNGAFDMTFFSHDGGQTSQLLCQIDSLDDINQIVIKQGVGRVKSLLFEFHHSSSSSFPPKDEHCWT